MRALLSSAFGLGLWLFAGGVALAGTCTTGAGNGGVPPKTDADGWAMVNICAGGSGGGGGGSVTQGTSPWVDNISQFGGTTVSIGQQVMAASMPVAIASNQTFANFGVIGAATAPTQMAVVGGVYNSAGVTLTTGQSAAIPLNSSGNMITADAFLKNVVIGGAPATAPTYTIPMAAKYLSTRLAQTTGQTQAAQSTSTGDLSVAPAPTVDANSATPPVATTASAQVSLLAKSSAGNLYSAYLTTATAAGFFEVVDSATVPADGAVVAKECVSVAAAGSASINFTIVPESFASGIALFYSTGTNCQTKLTTVGTAMFIKADVK